MLNYFNSKLRLKLVLLVVAGIVSAFTIIGAFRVYVDKQQIISDERRSGQERAMLIAEAVANLLIGYDYSNMESLAERILQQQDLRQVIIRNRAGKVLKALRYGLKPSGKRYRVSRIVAQHEGAGVGKHRQSGHRRDLRSGQLVQRQVEPGSRGAHTGRRVERAVHRYRSGRVRQRKSTHRYCA